MSRETEIIYTTDEERAEQFQFQNDWLKYLLEINYFKNPAITRALQGGINDRLLLI